MRIILETAAGVLIALLAYDVISHLMPWVGQLVVRLSLKIVKQAVSQPAAPRRRPVTTEHREIELRGNDE